MRRSSADLECYRDREARWIFAVVNLRYENTVRDMLLRLRSKGERLAEAGCSHGEDLGKG